MDSVDYKDELPYNLLIRNNARELKLMLLDEVIFLINIQIYIISMMSK